MTESARILIVDDEESVRRVVRHILETGGHVCSDAGDAQQARTVLRDAEFDLVLCDVNMPGESGLDLVGAILHEHPETAVVMVTGMDDPSIANVAIEAGAYGYVLKPFTRSQIVIDVANALRRRQLEIESRADRRQLVETIRERTEELWRTIHRLEKADAGIRASVEETVQRLSLAAELRDEDTARHIDRMSRYAALIAARAGLDEENCEQIRLASRLHDAGKIGIPDRILRKRGKYRAEEMEIMKGHSALGYELLADTRAALLERAAVIAWTHHERWDGNGYPRGIAGEDIPLDGRIAAVADVFDALTSRRSYKPAFPMGQAVEIVLEGRGTHFDPSLVDLFVENLDVVASIARQYPDDTLVR